MMTLLMRKDILTENEAYRRTGCRPALIDPILVSKKEHIFGKKKFSTRAKFHEKGRWHEISIECKNKGNNNYNVDSLNGVQPEMEIRIDGHLVIHVKHLQWKFRGNESIHLSKMRVEVYWDVHDWLFSPGLKHALFIFKPILSSSTTTITSMSSSSPSLSSSSPPLSTVHQTRSSGSVEGFSVGGYGGGDESDVIGSGGGDNNIDSSGGGDIDSVGGGNNVNGDNDINGS